jgi:hypothetical protein
LTGADIKRNSFLEHLDEANEEIILSPRDSFCRLFQQVKSIDWISTVIGCPGVMTILSHELDKTGLPAEVLCPSFLAGFVVRKSYCCTSLWVALMQAAAAENLQLRLSMKLVE